MKVIVSKESGVCFGVKRALDLVCSAANGSEQIATLGPLIHNPQVVHSLEERGVRVVKSIDQVTSGSIVMPSHGVPREIINSALKTGLSVIDATCPFVANVHSKVESLSSDGYQVVVVGDAGHSEVKAILSAAGEGALVLSSVDDVDKHEWTNKRIGIVSQTTQTPERFGEVVGAIASKAAEVVAFNTICYATHNRQNAAAELAPEVDAMFVVGGRNSANTNRLAEICINAGVPTYHIETSSEIDLEWISGMNIVGLTAGASTPDWIINEVKDYLEGL